MGINDRKLVALQSYWVILTECTFNSEYTQDAAEKLEERC